MERKTYGYIRVSSTDQNEDRQLIALRDAGVPEKHIYIDKMSGKDFNRPQYKKMVKKVREVGNESYSYAADYQTITALKSFTDKYNLTILVVHHTRKMEAADSFDMISGTNGLLGAADGAIIVQKKKRTDNEATMQVVGRDQPDQELKVEFNREKCIWELTKAETQLFERPVDPLILKVAAFMEHCPMWSGTASQLLEQMQLTEVKPHALTRKLNVNVSVLFNKFRIKYWQGARTGGQHCQGDRWSDLHCPASLQPEQQGDPEG